MGAIAHYTLPEKSFQQAREALQEQDAAEGVAEDPTCGMEGSKEYTFVTDGGETLQFCSKGCLETYRQQLASRGSWRDELQSWGGWYKLANQYRKEWSMLYKDVIAGFIISGFVIVFVPQWVWNTLFLQGDSVLVSAENAVMGVTVAIVSFVGSIGNVPFAVALWTGGVGFAGVIAFVYVDLVTIPVLNVYRKYYGWPVMLYILGVFSVTMAFTGFLMEQLFDFFGLVPNLAGGQTATERTYFDLDYTLVLNIFAFGVSLFLYTVYRRGLGASGTHRDPVCGMRVDEFNRRETFADEMYYFCSERCRRVFADHPAQFAVTDAQPSDHADHSGHAHD